VTKLGGSLVLASFGSFVGVAVIVALRSGAVRSGGMARGWALLAGVPLGWGVTSALWLYFFQEPLWDWVRAIMGPLNGVLGGLLIGAYMQRYFRDRQRVERGALTPAGQIGK
jgi:hypothetical protein